MNDRVRGGGAKLVTKWLVLAGALAIASGVWIASTPAPREEPPAASVPTPPEEGVVADEANVEPVLAPPVAAPPAAYAAPAASSVVAVPREAEQSAPAEPGAAPALPTPPLNGAPALPPPSAAPSSPMSPSGAGESAQLDTVRRVLQKRGLRMALTPLDHDETYDRGALREDAQVLRIEALSLSQQRHEAQRLAVRFLQTHPNSAHADHVRSLVEVDAGR